MRQGGVLKVDCHVFGVFSYCVGVLLEGTQVEDGGGAGGALLLRAS
eukprot:COSAG02_NODE_37989_length_435_cov_0.586310_2_plen_46_part_00